MTKVFSKVNDRVEPVLRQFLPPCQIRCPIHEDIQRTNVLLSLLPDDPEAARQPLLAIGDYLFEQNPLFPVCGYVCGLCELACSYEGTGGAIRRRLLKRFVADSYREKLAAMTTFARTELLEKVAIIGGGPAGLMAAFALSRNGYRPSIFESGDRLGGALWLIPHYRLPQEILAQTLAAVVTSSGIEVRYNSAVGEEELELYDLRREGFSAFFIATGSPVPRVLTYEGAPVPGQQLTGVMYGHSFLYEIAHGAIPDGYFKGRRVIVAGGGNVAFDAARSARRLGADTTLVCLECKDRGSADAIPADHNEVVGAEEEGVRIIYSRGVSAINASGSVFRSIDAPSCLGVYDERGFNPRFDTGDSIELEGEFLLIAVGQGPERGLLLHEKLLDGNGRLAVDPLTMQSINHPDLFVGGDMCRIGFMADAMRDGLEAAESMHRFIRGLDLKAGRKIEFSAPPEPFRHSYRPEPPLNWLPPEQRLDFRVFENGFTLSEAIAEAKRCLACGPCASCKACVAAGIQDELPRLEIYEERCSGCGICVASCPYGAAALAAHGDRKVSIIDRVLCKGCGLCVSACPSGARRLVGDNLRERFAALLERSRGES